MVKLKHGRIDEEHAEVMLDHRMILCKTTFQLTCRWWYRTAHGKDTGGTWFDTGKLDIRCW